MNKNNLRLPTVLRPTSRKRTPRQQILVERSKDKLALSSLPLNEFMLFMRFLGSDLLFSLLNARDNRIVKSLNLMDERGLRSVINPRSRSYKDGVHRIMLSEISRTEWSESIVAEIEQRLGMNYGINAPRELWEMLGLGAWNDPRFRYALAKRVEIEMRKRIWYGLEGTPTIQFTPTLFWMLIALVPLPTNILQMVRSILPGAQQSPLNIVQDIARTTALESTESLTIWDQWVLLHAEQAWRSKRDRSEDLLKTRIATLPIQSIVHASTQSQLPLDLSMPNWFRVWLQTRIYLNAPQGINNGDS